MTAAHGYGPGVNMLDRSPAPDDTEVLGDIDMQMVVDQLTVR